MSIKKFKKYIKKLKLNGTFIVTYEGTKDGISMDILIISKGKIIGSELGIHYIYDDLVKALTIREIEFID